MSEKRLSPAFRLLRRLGMNYSEEEYGDVSLARAAGRFFGNLYHALLVSRMDWWILEPVNPRLLRPRLLRGLGCRVGKGVFVGDHVRIDLNHADRIRIEDHVHIAAGCRLLCHQRDLRDYYVGGDYARLGYRYGEIRLCRGCLIGMESFVLPGVTVGEGAIVGAGSLVTKDIPAWTIATGRPAAVVKHIPEKP